MIFKFFVSIFLIFVFSCSSWDKKTVSQNNGENVFIKINSGRCNSWIKLYEEVISLSKEIQNQSVSSSYSCIQRGPDDSDMKVEPMKELVFEKYEAIVMDTEFESYKLDNCFGAPASNLLNIAFVNSMNSFYNARMLCSQSVQKLFRMSKDPKDYINRFKSYIKSDYDRLEKIDVQLSNK